MCVRVFACVRGWVALRVVMMESSITGLMRCGYTLMFIPLNGLGLRQAIEQVLSQDFTPGLRWAASVGENHSVFVSLGSLQAWLVANCWSGADSGNHPTRPPPQRRIVKLKRPAVVAPPTRPAEIMAEGATGSGNCSLMPPAKMLRVKETYVCPFFVYMIVAFQNFHVHP